MATRKHIEWLLEGVESWNERRERDDFRPDLAGADLYAEFRNLGKINEGENLPLRRVNLSQANLTQTRFCCNYTTGGADLRWSNLRLAKLQDCQLANSRLDGATLIGTNLDRANLLAASFRDAKMSGVRLQQTDLFQADLTDADLSLGCLKDANFVCAKLVNTNLSTANLTGAQFERSRPWQARLYEETQTANKNQLCTGDGEKIVCVSDLIRVCSSIQAEYPDCVLYYRGEHKDTWDLRPSVMRKKKKAGYIWRKKESDMLLDLMSRRPEDFNYTTSALVQWVLAQHHGLKTRLLDVTRNPLVAMFASCESECGNGRLHVFAVPRDLKKPFNSDTISIIANFAKLTSAEQDLLLGWTGEDISKRDPDAPLDIRYEHAMRRLYHLIRQEKPHFEKRINPRHLYQVYVVEPQQSFERIRTQSGAFLISAFHERFERSEVLKYNAGIPIYDYGRLVVPKEKKKHIRKELNLLNVTHETLFPGLDEAARAVTERHSE